MRTKETVKKKIDFVGKTARSVSRKGFTLIEMLLVIAIIGILVGVVYVMIGNSDDAKTKSVLSTQKSIMPYAQECNFKGAVLKTDDANEFKKDEIICEGSVTKWPKPGPDECSYDHETSDGTTWVVKCAFNNPMTVTCNAVNGDCGSAIDPAAGGE